MTHGSNETSKIKISFMRILFVVVVLGFLSMVSTQTSWGYQEEFTYDRQTNYERYIPTIEDDFADN